MFASDEGSTMGGAGRCPGLAVALLLGVPFFAGCGGGALVARGASAAQVLLETCAYVPAVVPAGAESITKRIADGSTVTLERVRAAGGLLPSRRDIESGADFFVLGERPPWCSGSAAECSGFDCRMSLTNVDPDAVARELIRGLGPTQSYHLNRSWGSVAREVTLPLDETGSDVELKISWSEDRSWHVAVAFHYAGPPGVAPHEHFASRRQQALFEHVLTLRHSGVRKQYEALQQHHDKEKSEYLAGMNRLHAQQEAEKAAGAASLQRSMDAYFQSFAKPLPAQGGAAGGGVTGAGAAGVEVQMVHPASGGGGAARDPSGPCVPAQFECACGIPSFLPPIEKGVPRPNPACPNHKPYTKPENPCPNGPPCGTPH